MPWFCDLGTHVEYLFHDCSEELSTVLGTEHSSQQSFGRLSDATNQGVKGTEIIFPILSLQMYKELPRETVITKDLQDLDSEGLEWGQTIAPPWL